MKNIEYLSIIPQPKKIVFKKGGMRLLSSMQIFVDANNVHHAKEFLRKVRTMGFPAMKINIIDTRKHIFMIAEKISMVGIGKPVLNKKEGYELHIEKKRIWISSTDSAGLFYGIQTLVQIFEDNSNPPLCIISDWPDMDIRGIHFDLKGGMPKFSYLKEFIKKLAHYKINTILVEYEDKFLFTKHPVLAAKSALTRLQAKELDRLARENHIEIIPLMQSLGHAEYILRHPEYSYLRESNDEIQQMCPSNPKTLEFFKEICTEFFEIHPNSRYFHIGGDETRQLGECKTCKARTKKTGKYLLYFEYIKNACEFIIENGRIPIIWDDIITRHTPELFALLPKKTTIMYWLYGIKSDRQNYCYAKNGILTSKQWIHKIYDHSQDLPPGVTDSNFIEDLPKDEYREMKKYSDSEDFPRSFSSTIFLRKMQDKGLKVIGASAALCSEDGFISNPERAIPNIRTWANAIQKHRRKGVVSTAWARGGTLASINGLMEGNWYPFLASAEFYWSAKACDEKSFDQKYCKRFYGLDNREVTDCIWLIRHQKLAGGREKLENRFNALIQNALRNNWNLYYYSVFSKVLQLQSDVEQVFIYSSPNIQYMAEQTFLPARRLNAFKTHIASLVKESSELKKEVREICKKILHPSEIDECMASYFKRLDDMIKMILDKMQ
ncbi:MAG: family 20 glycosylhydrolase [Candidatus Theseobacter exili]|nr:family 20 glycosylhydrolase [Candidatus Theseobacter exili]